MDDLGDQLQRVRLVLANPDDRHVRALAPDRPHELCDIGQLGDHLVPQHAQNRCDLVKPMRPFTGDEHP